ncbi:hypothetical protein RYX36_000958 [Vicia faba]
MHSPHEEQGDDDDHAEQIVQDEAGQEHRNAHILINVPQVIRKRNGRFIIQPEGSSSMQIIPNSTGRVQRVNIQIENDRLKGASPYE